MHPSTRKRLAEIYDESGQFNIPYSGTGESGSILVSCYNIKDVEEIRRLLEHNDVHTTVFKRKPPREGFTIFISKRRDVLLLCVTLFPYLKNQEKREKMVSNWRELGWCICENV